MGMVLYDTMWGESFVITHFIQGDILGTPGALLGFPGSTPIGPQNAPIQSVTLASPLNWFSENTF